MASIPSESGLPGPSVAWGRAISSSLREVSSGLDSLSGGLSSLSSSASGQVSQASRLVRERSDRQSHYVGITDFSISSPGSALWVTKFSEEVQIPAPDVPRNSLLYVSAASALESGNDSAIVWWELLLNGAIVGGVNTVVSPRSPDWGTPSFILSTVLSGPSTVQVRARLQKFANRNMSVSWYNGSAAVIYGDKA